MSPGSRRGQGAGRQIMVAAKTVSHAYAWERENEAAILAVLER